MPDRGLHDLNEREAAMLAASLAELAASNRLDKAHERLASAIRRAEAACGSTMSEPLHKAEANARIQADQALGAYREAVRLRMQAEVLAEISTQGHVDAIRPTVDAFERHVLAWRGVTIRSKREQILKAALALASEAGEVAGAVEKWAYRDAPLDAPALLAELGDVFYNLADLTLALGASLRDVAMRNEAKWATRYPGGPAASKARTAFEARATTWRQLAQFLRR